MRSRSSFPPWPARPTSSFRSAGRPPPLHDAREYDAVVAAGEQVTSGLLAIILEDMGVQARSWQGWQLPIATDNAHGVARILDVNGEELIKRFREHGQVAVISGFQGMHKDTGRITTLGRGGSDTSAVAVAAAIRADRCDIYTDVDGVYTTDPNIVEKARRLDKVAYEEMLEMASLGAKVLQVRSVELAMQKRVRVFVRSSFDKPEDVDPHGTPYGHAHLRRGGDRGKPGCDGHRLLEGRGADFDPPRRRQAGRCRLAVRPARRRKHQRGHDRPEHLGRRPHRHYLHGAGRRLRAGATDACQGQEATSASRRSKARPTS